MTKTQLCAGFGKGEIVFPQELFPLESFIGVHDSPWARVMVLDAGGERMAIASLEMVNVPPKGIALCQEAISQKTGTPTAHIWVHVTHAITTMHEPGPKGPPDQRPPATEEDRRKQQMFFDAIKGAITEAAQQAADSYGPAKLGWATGTCGVNINRDVETPHGWWTGLNPDGPSNKTMTILRVEDLSGNPKGFWINYGIKPCAIDIAGMETGDRLVSTDVSGVCCRMMEERFGVPAVFCVSAAGDQVPREMAFLDVVNENGQVEHEDLGVSKGLEMAALLGAEMGRDAITIAERVVCGETEGAIRHRALTFQWPGKAARLKGPEAPVKAYPIEGEHTMEAEIFTIGNAAFVAEKPEVNCQTELELKENSPYPTTCLICMVNGGMKYMPDRLGYERNTAEAQNSALQPGAAERFVAVVTAALKDMKGEACGG